MEDCVCIELERLMRYLPRSKETLPVKLRNEEYKKENKEVQKCYEEELRKKGLRNQFHVAKTKHVAKTNHIQCAAI